MLSEKIREIHDWSRGTYGAPRVHAALHGEGIRVGKKRVARLMKAAGLRGVSRRKRPSTTIGDGARPAPDLVERDFNADEPESSGSLTSPYPETCTDRCGVSVPLRRARRVQSADSAEILRRLGNGRPPAHRIGPRGARHGSEQRDPDETVHHSDQGSQYTAVAFGQRCKDAGVRPSMGSVGDCYDNAMCESFTTGTSFRNARMRTHRKSYTHSIGGSPQCLRLHRWYNPHRLHSALDYQVADTL